MKQLLYVDCCIRGEQSRTRKLAEAFLAALPQEWQVTRLDLMREGLQPLMPDTLASRDETAARGELDAPRFRYAHQIAAADAVVMAAPFWDLSYPAALRTYSEYISANGLTYHYDAAGCHGDCAAGYLVYLTSCGDVEREDSVGVIHWRQLAAMFGIPQFDYVFAGGLDARPDMAGDTLTAACTLAGALAKTL